MNTKDGWVNISVTKKKQGTEDGLGKNIENTVEDSFGVGSNDVATLRHTPSNWVKEPEEDSPSTTHEEGSGHRRIDGGGVQASNENDIVCNAEECYGSEDKVTPLVR